MDGWDDIALLEPHAESFETGKEKGKLAGQKAGFEEGRALGQSKGIEFGIELGFYRGVLEALNVDFVTTQATQNENNTDSGEPLFFHNQERVLKSMKQLQRVLDEFPSPNDMFSQLQQPQQQEEEEEEEGEKADELKLFSSLFTPGQEHASDPYKDDSEIVPDNSIGDGPAKYDVMAKLQRVRARFKLLMVQLGHTHFSLQNVMRTNDTIIPEEGSKPTMLPPKLQPLPGDHEW